MGYKLVGAAIHPHWSSLTHLQHRVLVIMANTALDHPSSGRPRAIFWGGWNYISLCIFGTDAPSGGQIHSIQRAVAALIKAGAVERVRSAQGGRRARYRLILDEFKQPELPPLETEVADTSGTTSDADPADTSGTSTVDTSGTSSSRIADTSCTSKLIPHVPAEEVTEEEKKEEEANEGDIEQLSAQPHLGARASELNKPERCAECGRPERDCRARAARHGQHDYRPVEYAPLRLA